MIFRIPGKKKPGQDRCPRIEHFDEWHSFVVKTITQRYDSSDSTKRSGEKACRLPRRVDFIFSVSIGVGPILRPFT